MATPVERGTLSGTPFTSQHASVIYERLYITPDARFKTALFSVHYEVIIDEKSSGVPFLFLAMMLKDSAHVTLDGKPVAVKPVPKQYLSEDPWNMSPLSKLRIPAKDKNDGFLVIPENWHSGRSISQSDLIYFEVDLSPGRHSFDVSYLADRWTDRSDWIACYYFRYSLYPAYYWKSFGSLDVVLDSRKCSYPIQFNKENTAVAPGIHTWHFEHLPGYMLEFRYKPVKSPTTMWLIRVGPMRLALLFWPLLFIAHVLLLRYVRMNHFAFRFLLIAGSILISLVVGVLWMKAYDFIDSYTGADHGIHGYTVFVFVWTPLTTIIHYSVMSMLFYKTRRKPNN